MITTERGNLVITFGKFTKILPDAPLGITARLSFARMEKKISWIKDDKTKMYILVKMIKGWKYKDTLNFIFKKGYLIDKDYRDLVG